MRKSVQISFGPNFVVLGLNKEIYNSGKYGPTKTPNFSQSAVNWMQYRRKQR